MRPKALPRGLATKIAECMNLLNAGSHQAAKHESEVYLEDLT